MGIDNEWETITEADTSEGGDIEWETVSQTDAGEAQATDQPGFLQKASDVYQRYRKSPLYQASPLGLLGKAGELATRGFEKAGERTAEYLGEKQVNPYVAAGLGTAVSMAPDIALTAAAPLASRAGTSRYVPEMALPYARRALGMPKAMLKTPFARGQAQRAARTALEENVIPLSGSPSEMLSRATELSSKAGQRIGSVLGKGKADFQKASADLEILRDRLSLGTKEGVFSKVNSAIDSVQQTITELSKGPSKSLSDLNKLKNRVGQSINYLSDLAAQGDNKAIQNTLANSIRDMVKSFTSPQEFTGFLKNQKLYNAAKLMERGLNNEVAGQMGNRLFSPYSAIAGAGQLAAGRPGAAVASLGVAEGLLRRGAGTTAKALTQAGRAAPAAAVGAVEATRAGQKILNESKAREYIDKAKGDLELARKMALKDGWTIPE